MSTATVKRNSELEARLAELELELSVWKQAHASVAESADRDKKAHNAQVSTLNRQISSLDTIKVSVPRSPDGVLLTRLHDLYFCRTTQSQNPLILCVIDGNSNIFSPSLLSQGLHGGQQAAQQLTKGIAEYLSQEDVQVFGRLSFWITIYFNRTSMLEILLGNSLCAAEVFEDFLIGFGQSSPRFQLVEVGPGREAMDAKIKGGSFSDHCYDRANNKSRTQSTYTHSLASLRRFACLSQVRVTTPAPCNLSMTGCTGGHDNAYLSTLTSLGQEELLGKLVFLQGYNDLSSEMLQLALPLIQVPGLLLSQKPTMSLTRRSGPPGPLTIPSTMGSVTTTGGLMSPQSETHSVTGHPRRPVTAGKPIDPAKVSASPLLCLLS